MKKKSRSSVCVGVAWNDTQIFLYSSSSQIQMYTTARRDFVSLTQLAFLKSW